MPVAWSRRAVLLALGAGAFSTLTGCGIRLEHDAIHLPFVPTIEPVPDQEALLRALAQARSLQERAVRAGGASRAVPAQLAWIHGQQAAALEQLLRADNVPVPVATTTVPRATPSAKAAAHAAKMLGAEEASDVTAATLSGLAAVHSANIAVLGTILVQRAVAGTLLGHTPTWPGITGVQPELAATLLKSTRPAVYGFEIIAAQTPIKQRPGATAALEALRSQRDALEALVGTSAPPASMGYRLPFPVTDEASGRKLAQRILTRLIESTAALLDAPKPAREAAAGVVQLLSRTVVLGVPWGVALTPFPGLR